MRNYLILLLLLFGQVLPAPAATVPLPDPPLSPAQQLLKRIPPAGAERLTGKKSSLRERFRTRLLQQRLLKAVGNEEGMTEKQKQFAKWSLYLGLGSIAILLIPYAGLLAIPAAIVAIVLGAKSLRGNSNTKGIIGIIAGGLTILTFIVGIIVVLALLSGFS